MPAAGGDDCSSPPPPPPPLHLLEVTVISAQDLQRRRLLGRRVRAYAVAWADEAHKLRTGVDPAGGAAPTWNDRFLFRVGDAFLLSDTAAVTVEVRAARGLVRGDRVLGYTRIVVSTFARPGSHGRQVAALQLRRPRSLRPQGIVNVAVALLDDALAARTVPRYGVPDSPDAFAVKDLVVVRRPASSSLGKIDEEPDADERPAIVDHSDHLDSRGAAVEQRKLELTLEKWKADLSPGSKDGKRSRRRMRSFCFDWDR